MFSHILVVSGGYILLISICPLLTIWKLPVIASYTLAISFKNYFKRVKIWWLFAQLYKNFTDCFVLEVLTVNTTLCVSRFQDRICTIKSQEKKIKFYM